jgi:hypothetical protein
MTNTSILARRFSELTEQLQAVEATKKHVRNDYSNGDYVDDELLLNWRVKARNLLSKSCGIESEHYREFIKRESIAYMGRTNHDQLVELKAVFSAAKEDYEGGYLNSVRNLVQAEVFSTEIDQAKELLSSGFSAPAAVVAGVVLETTIRKLCKNAGITASKKYKLDKMNADLAKAGVYNLLVQKRITALADIRNNAAHGHYDQFEDSDVSDMIAYVETFVADRL